MDASVFVRALVEPLDEDAIGWVEATNDRRIAARTPELALAEIANAFVGYVRAGLLDEERALARLRYVLDMPIDVVSLRLLAVPALGVSLTRGLSAYDACYVALANGCGATLVTADRRLAAEAEQSALLPGTGPPA